MSWTKIQGEELQRLRTRLDLSPPQSSTLEASTLRTPFYSNGALVKINDGVDNVFMVAAGPGEISAREYYPLNGRSVDIYAANMARRVPAGDMARVRRLLEHGQSDCFSMNFACLLLIRPR